MRWSTVRRRRVRGSTGPVSILVTILISWPLAGQLNDTGVRQCHDALGGIISCRSAPAGDDGRFGRDASASMGLLAKTGQGPAGFDFTKISNDGRDLPSNALRGNGPSQWACTRDNATGLTWEVKMDGDADLRSRRQHFTWYDPDGSRNGGNAGSRRITTHSSCNGLLNECNSMAYLDRLNQIGLCGHRDWRLPTPDEMRGIVDYGIGLAGDFSADYFTLPDPQWPNPHYLTSVTYAAETADVWLVEVGGESDGGGGGHHHPKNEARLILAVRGGTSTTGDCRAGSPRGDVLPSTPTSEFIDHGDGTATHTTTGLMWKRCAEGRSGSLCENGPPPPLDAEGFRWSEAIERAESSTFAGYTDWRLPNLKELLSIVEHCGHRMAINGSIFPATPLMAGGAVFWTSTPDPAVPSRAFLVAFEHGGAVWADKQGKLYLRLVRGGGQGGFDAQSPRLPRRRPVRSP